MEWMNRGQGQGQPTGQSVNHTPSPAAAQPGRKQKRGFSTLTGIRWAQVVLLFSATILAVAVVWFVALGGSHKPESSFVDEDKLQAVFLSGGQVYFGNINELNGKYLSMDNIYYLRVNQQVQPDSNTTNSDDISLVKLGCELHGPQDNMVVNREQVIFWENLKDDGQVAKAVKEYQTQNPNGQQCDTNTGAGTNNNASQNQNQSQDNNNNTNDSTNGSNN